jgi:hypothetical protein
MSNAQPRVEGKYPMLDDKFPGFFAEKCKVCRTIAAP